LLVTSRGDRNDRSYSALRIPLLGGSNDCDGEGSELRLAFELDPLTLEVKAIRLEGERIRGMGALAAPQTLAVTPAIAGLANNTEIHISGRGPFFTHSWSDRDTGRFIRGEEPSFAVSIDGKVRVRTCEK
jgi:hypothetical protein